MIAAVEGEKLIADRNKFICIADRSEHGWATVAEYEDDELANDSDDEKKLFKVEAWVGRKTRLQLAKSKTAGGWWHRLPAGASANPSVLGWSVQSPATSTGSSTTPQVDQVQFYCDTCKYLNEQLYRPS